MPTVDINAPSQGSSGGEKKGFGTGLPTPVLLAIVGGGIGLVVFLSRRNGEGDEEGTLLPNTAVMLGSLQQGILEIMGKVTMGNADLGLKLDNVSADLSSQIAGVGTNLGLQIDTQTGEIRSGFAGVNAGLGNLSSTLTGQYDALSSILAGLGTQNAGLAAGIQKILGGIEQTLGQIQEVKGGINNVINGQNTLAAGMNALGKTDQNLISIVTDLASKVNANPGAPQFAFDWHMLDGKLLFSEPDQTFYTVQDGKVKTVSWWDTNPGRDFDSDRVPRIFVKTSLSPLSTGQYVPIQSHW